MTQDLALAADETVAWAGHPRLTAVLPAVALGLAIVIGGVILLSIDGGLFRLGGVLASAVGVAIPAWSYLSVVNTEFTVTNHALYRQTGVVSRSVRRIELDRVQDASFSQHIRGRLFGYGTLTFEVAGGGALRFYRIDDPTAVQQMVDQTRRSSDEIPGSLDQWRAVREEVRALRRTIERG